MDHAAFGLRVAAKRGATGIRMAARDAGVSPATLSRIENGHVPDIDIFERLCRWIGADPSEFLDGPAQEAVGTVQFKKVNAVSPETALALGELVMAVFEMVRAESQPGQPR